MKRSSRKKVTRITAMLLSTVAGLLAGLSAWSIMAPQVLPDLSEQPSVVSYYTLHDDKAGRRADRR